MNELLNKIGSIEQDNLIAHIEPRAHTMAIKVAAGEGKLKRGTVLGMNSAGTYQVYGKAVAKSAKFNGDGTTDFAMINYENVIALGGIMNGTLSYWAVLNGVDTNEWRLAGIGDYNGDGTDDIAWCNSGNLAGYWQINDMQQTGWGTIGILA